MVDYSESERAFITLWNGIDEQFDLLPFDYVTEEECEPILELLNQLAGIYLKYDEEPIYFYKSFFRYTLDQFINAFTLNEHKTYKRHSSKMRGYIGVVIVMNSLQMALESSIAASFEEDLVDEDYEDAVSILKQIFELADELTEHYSHYEDS